MQLTTDAELHHISHFFYNFFCIFFFFIWVFIAWLPDQAVVKIVILGFD